MHFLMDCPKKQGYFEGGRHLLRESASKRFHTPTRQTSTVAGPLDPTSAGIGIIEKYQIAVGDSGIAVLQALVK
jgi:hypothetical protein